MTSESTNGEPPGRDDSAVRPLVFPPVLILGALFVGCGLDWWVALPVFERPWVGHAAGWPLFVLGGLLARSAERTMRSADVDPRFRAVPTIVESGLYARTRNPMYLTVAVAYVGLALVTNTWWPLLFLPGVFLVLHFGVVLREERYLADRFGDAYRDYCRRVRRWL